jgi:hypothetical protein
MGGPLTFWPILSADRRNLRNAANAFRRSPEGSKVPWSGGVFQDTVVVMLDSSTRDLVLRPAIVIPERIARQLLAWLDEHDVTGRGCWDHDVGYIKRFSGPFDGPSGMRGSAVLLGSIHLTWDRYEATVYRAVVTEQGAVRGLTVEGLCDELLAPVGLTLASCPRARLLDPARDPFRRLPRPREGAS